MLQKHSPKSSLAKHITVVSTEDDDSVIVQLAVFNHAEKLANAVIDVADGAIVCPPSPLDLFVGKVLVPEVAHLEETLAVRVLFFLGDFDFW
jgi:hypothetical protein